MILIQFFNIYKEEAETIVKVLSELRAHFPEEPIFAKPSRTLRSSLLELGGRNKSVLLVTTNLGIQPAHLIRMALDDNAGEISIDPKTIEVFTQSVEKVG